MKTSVPMWVRTVRFRLTVTYSALLFGLAAMVVGVIYMAVRRHLNASPVSARYLDVYGYGPPGDFTPTPGLRLADVETVERWSTAQTLNTLRSYSLWALLLLFVLSLGIGWWLSGRALAPVDRITRTAREISATDLTRRIHLTGPDDELRRLADTIDDMLDRLGGAFDAQRQLVDDASHELRNPLAIIQANVETVLARDDSSTQERERAAAVVSRASARMTRLVDDLLATARRAGPSFVESDVDIAQLGREALDEQELVALESQVLLRSGLPDGIIVNGDRDALRRALGNLLSNAVRFSPTGCEVLLAAGRTGDWAWLGVRDAGPGIADTDQLRVFDRFYRVARRARHDGHAGLGLAIVRQIVESHGGCVGVHSTPGTGSTFVIWLPVRDRSPDGLPAPVASDPLGHRFAAPNG